MERVVVVQIFAIPVVDDPVFENFGCAFLVRVGYEKEVCNFSHQTDLLAANSCRQNRLLLE